MEALPPLVFGPPFNFSLGMVFQACGRCVLFLSLRVKNKVYHDVPCSGCNVFFVLRHGMTFSNFSNFAFQQHPQFFYHLSNPFLPHGNLGLFWHWIRLMPSIWVNLNLNYMCTFLFFCVKRCKLLFAFLLTSLLKTNLM